MKFPFKKNIMEKLKNSESKTSLTRDLIGFKLFQSKLITTEKNNQVSITSILPDIDLI